MLRGGRGRPAGLEIWGDRGGGGGHAIKPERKRGWDFSLLFSPLQKSVSARPEILPVVQLQPLLLLPKCVGKKLQAWQEHLSQIDLRGWQGWKL